MVSILFTVLKITGLVLLAILGLIIFILLLVLFVPARYSGGGSYQDGSYIAKLRASWLLHMISVRGIYQKEQPFHVYLKVFGITVYDNLRMHDRKTRHKKEKPTETKTEGTGEIQAASVESTTKSDTFFAEHTDNTAQEDGVFQKEQGNYDISENPDTKTGMNKISPDSGKKLGIVQKIKNILTKFVNFFKNIKFTFDKVCDTIVRIKDNIKHYLEVLQLDSTKQAFAVCQKQLVYVIKKLLPRKYQVNLHLGFEDPAVMGEVLAVWGMFYPLHMGRVNIEPEFGQSVMEVDCSFHGHISAAVFLRAACILFLDRNVRSFLNDFKRSGI